MKIRHQLPAYSPISVRATIAATAQTLALGADPRPRLRELLRRDYGSSGVLLCGSGTQALALAIREAANGASSGAVVALPAFSCFDIATAAIGAGVRVSLYDLNPNTLAPEHESLERVLRAGARVVVVASLYGIPLDWDALSALAGRYGALLIEDAAQGHGARWRGKPLGGIGEIATLSFGRAKGWTGGHGGALLINAPHAPRATDLASPGFVEEANTAVGLAAQWALGRPAVYGIPHSIPMLRLGETVYRTPQSPSSLGRVAAATILAMRDASEREAARRKMNAKELLSAIAENSRLAAISIHREGVPGYLRLPLRLPRGMGSFESQMGALARGIAPSYPSSLADLPQLAGTLEGPERAWPGAQTLVRELVTLPTHSRLSPRDLSELRELLRGLQA